MKNLRVRKIYRKFIILIKTIEIFIIIILLLINTDIYNNNDHSKNNNNNNNDYDNNNNNTKENLWSADIVIPTCYAVLENRTAEEAWLQDVPSDDSAYPDTRSSRLIGRTGEKSKHEITFYFKMIKL